LTEVLNADEKSYDMEKVGTNIQIDGGGSKKVSRVWTMDWNET
jgi:hypothetical protein